MSVDEGVREYDPLGDGTAVPYEVQRELRAKCPVLPLGGGDYYLARYEDVQMALKSVDNFVGSFRDPGVVVPEEEKLISEIAEPRHGKVRRILNTAITGHRLDGVEQYTYELASSLAASLVGRGEVDLMAGFARTIPSAVIGELLGAPRDEHAFWADWSEELANDEWIRLNRNSKGEGFPGAFPEATARFEQMITTRRDSPDRSDFIARLGQAEIDGRHLSVAEMRMVLVFLFAAGNETTRNVMGQLLARLATDRELFETLSGDRSLVEAAVEETLRLNPPLPYLLRFVTADIDIGGQTLCPGERAMFGLSSANRDEAAFEDPDEMRLDREDPRKHVSFGHGPHICPGASLARMEMRSALNAFFDNVGAMEPAQGWTFRKDPVWWTDGPKDVRVVLHPHV